MIDNDDRIVVRCNKEIKSYWQEVAKENNVSMSDFVRIAISMAISEIETWKRYK